VQTKSPCPRVVVVGSQASPKDCPMKHKAAPLAQDFMTRHVHTVAPEMSLADVIKFLSQHHISSAPVMQAVQGGHAAFVGFITEGDCLAFLANEVFFGSPSQSQTVETMMRRHPVCVEP